MSKKNILKGILLIIILLIIAFIITYGISKVNKNKQLEIINEELESLSKLNLETDEIDMNIKTKGSFAIVEETIKTYLKNIQDQYNTVIEICNTNEIDNLLTAQNIQEDAPEFEETKEILNLFKEEVNIRIGNYNNLLSEENIKQEIENKNLSDYYKELYLSLMLNIRVRNRIDKDIK